MLEAQAEKRKLGKVTVWGFVLRGFLVVDTPTSQQFQDFTLEFGVGETLLAVSGLYFRVWGGGNAPGFVGR